MIQPADLHKIWGAPDNTRLTTKQYSFRLPVHVAAKLAALCDMFPDKTRTQLVADLLSTALDGFERTFPSIPGEEAVDEFPGTKEPLYEETGPIVRYQALANEHYRALEAELGNEDPKPLYNARILVARSDSES